VNTPNAHLRHIKETYPTAHLLHETESSPFENSAEIPPEYIETWNPSLKTDIDLVITLGGDGTILRASSLFRTGPVPPVLSFSMGTLGFLLPFR
jgi:NADH kinase